MSLPRLSPAEEAAMLRPATEAGHTSSVGKLNDPFRAVGKSRFANGKDFTSGFAAVGEQTPSVVSFFGGDLRHFRLYNKLRFHITFTHLLSLNQSPCFHAGEGTAILPGHRGRAGPFRRRFSGLTSAFSARTKEPAIPPFSTIYGSKAQSFRGGASIGALYEAFRRAL
jgi:hypothetical protein